MAKLKIRGILTKLKKERNQKNRKKIKYEKRRVQT